MKKGTVFLRGIPVYLLLKELIQEFAARVTDADISVLAGNAVYVFPVYDGKPIPKLQGVHAHGKTKGDFLYHLSRREEYSAV